LYKGFVPTIQGLESGLYLPISELDAARNNAQGNIARNSLAYPVTQGFSQLNFAVYPTMNSYSIPQGKKRFFAILQLLAFTGGGPLSLT
jgi:hypothetical protein